MPANQASTDEITLSTQTTPLLAGLGVAAAAYGSRAAMQAWQAFKVAPPRLRQFYKVSSCVGMHVWHWLDATSSGNTCLHICASIEH